MVRLLKNTLNLNDRDREKARILFQFSLVTVISLIGGILFASLLSDGAIWRTSQKLLLSLNQDIPNDHLLSKIWSVSVAETIGILLIFLCSFTRAKYAVTNLALVFFGFKLGVSSSVVRLTEVSQIGFVHALAFWTFKGAILFLILYCAYMLGFMSLANTQAALGVNVVIKQFASKTVFALAVTLCLLLLNAIYCYIIYFL